MVHCSAEVGLVRQRRTGVASTPPSTLGGRADPRYDREVPFDLGLAVPPATAETRVRRLAAGYPADPVRRYETPALGWALGFYACYFVAIAAVVPMWAVVLPGVVCFLRYFNRVHESLHADTRGSGGKHPARWLLVVVGPVYLGYDELRELHLAHHREFEAPTDPDLAMLADPPWRAMVASLLQPEVSAVQYIRRRGLSPRLAGAMLLRAGVFAGLMALGGWWGALLYNLMTRIGNTGAFFVFSWLVHRQTHYQVRPPPFPRAIAAVWGVLFGLENLDGIRFHYLHHCCPHVPDRHLATFAQSVLAMGAR
jgi:fatty acid desaturase